MEIYVKISSISIFSLFLVFHHDLLYFIIFYHIAASNAATDDVTNYVIHRVSNMNI